MTKIAIYKNFGKQLYVIYSHDLKKWGFRAILDLGFLSFRQSICLSKFSTRYQWFLESTCFIIMYNYNLHRFKYNLDVMRPSACLVITQTTVYSYSFLFNYTRVNQAWDLVTTLSLIWCIMLVFWLGLLWLELWLYLAVTVCEIRTLFFVSSCMLIWFDCFSVVIIAWSCAS